MDVGAFEYGSPALLKLAPVAGRKLEVVTLGKRLQPCRLFISDDLLHWQPACTNQFGGDGVMIFHDDLSHVRRFYRLSLP